MKVKCNKCMAVFDEEDIIVSADDKEHYCPKCGAGINYNSCNTCSYFDSKDWDSETKNWCRYKDQPATNEGLCGHYEPLIRPCPFCGSPVRVFTAIHGVHGAEDYYAIKHPEGTDCVVDGMETSSYADKEELIEDWNRRAQE